MQFQEYGNKRKINLSVSESDLKHEFENEIVTMKF
jgi:hypothetical protein